jgi:hypothetical protein
MSTKLKAGRIGHYRNAKSAITFKYVVNGSEEALKAYEEAQGGYFRVHENEKDPNDPLNGKPLWFTTKALPDEIELTITTNGKVIHDEATEDVALKALAREEEIERQMCRIIAEELVARRKVSKPK